MTRSLFSSLHAAAVFASVLFTGCANDATCFPGERFKSGLCLPSGSGSKGGTHADAGSTTGDAGADGAASGRTATFGADCLTNADCGNPAPVCAIQPTDPKGFCTQVDCVNAPAVCPAGWQCFDPSVINPDYPTLCVPAN
ncbi:MAG TPA: hypothetical protein VHE30_09810 [Polyangiaceae bacterium]|nr:hypothetical protein [Polyangiaceae bacterium]